MRALIAKLGQQILPSVTATLIAAAIISVYNHAFSDNAPTQRVPRIAPQASIDPAGLSPVARIEQAFPDERRTLEKEAPVDKGKQQGQVTLADPAPQPAPPQNVAPQPAAPQVTQPAPSQPSRVKTAKPAKPTHGTSVARPEPVASPVVRHEPVMSPPVIEVIEAPVVVAAPPPVQTTPGAWQPPRPAAEIPLPAVHDTIGPNPSRGARFLSAIEAAGNAILPSIRN